MLSETWARKYFGSLDILGEPIKIEGVGDLIVTGVMEDYPEGSTDFPFEMLISYKTKEKEFMEEGGWQSTTSDFQCYVLLQEGKNIKDLEERMPVFADKYYGADRKDSRVHEFQPLKDLHFNENFSNFRYRTVSRTNILVMVILGVFIIAIACINFINLSTAQAANRFREVGIRKVLGGTNTSIIFRFLGETGLITCIAVLMAMGLAELSLFSVNQFLDLNLKIDLIEKPNLWVFIFSVIAFVTLGAGLYPGLLLSRFRPSSTLKGGKKASRGTWRKSMVVFQFVISQVLIIGTLIIISQLNFYKNSPLGFDRYGIIDVFLPNNEISKMKVLQNSILQRTGVANVSLAWGPPAWGGVSSTNAEYESNGEREELDTQVKMCDENYLDVFGMKLLAGEGLTPSDSATRVVVNESFAKRMGYQDPDNAVGMIITLWGKDLPISGVVEDFHTRSFRNRIEPVALYSDISRYGIAAVKINPGSSIPDILKGIEKSYSEVYQGYSFNYSFMDETFANFYRGEEKMSKMLMVFSGIAIFIGCIGLYGMVSFMANKKTKEIGVRKVLGASVQSVLFIFSREFTILIVLAFLIASPLAYFGIGSWLSQFAYHVNPKMTDFLIGMSFTLIIALATISYKSIKASMTNPVDALKEE